MTMEYDQAFDDALAAAAILGAALARFDNARRKLAAVTPSEMKPKKPARIARGQP